MRSDPHFKIEVAGRTHSLVEATNFIPNFAPEHDAGPFWMSMLQDCLQSRRGPVEPWFPLQDGYSEDRASLVHLNCGRGRKHRLRMFLETLNSRLEEIGEEKIIVTEERKKRRLDALRTVNEILEGSDVLRLTMILDTWISSGKLFD